MSEHLDVVTELLDIVRSRAALAHEDVERRERELAAMSQDEGVFNRELRLKAKRLQLIRAREEAALVDLSVEQLQRRQREFAAESARAAQAYEDVERRERELAADAKLTQILQRVDPTNLAVMSSATARSPEGRKVAEYCEVRVQDDMPPNQVTFITREDFAALGDPPPAEIERLIDQVAERLAQRLADTAVPSESEGEWREI